MISICWKCKSGKILSLGKELWPCLLSHFFLSLLCKHPQFFIWIWKARLVTIFLSFHPKNINLKVFVLWKTVFGLACFLFCLEKKGFFVFAMQPEIPTSYIILIWKQYFKLSIQKDIFERFVPENGFWSCLVNKGFLFCLCSANILWPRSANLLYFSLWNLMKIS